MTNLTQWPIGATVRIKNYISVLQNGERSTIPPGTTGRITEYDDKGHITVRLDNNYGVHSFVNPVYFMELVSDLESITIKELQAEIERLRIEFIGAAFSYHCAIGHSVVFAKCLDPLCRRAREIEAYHDKSSSRDK